MRAESRPFPRSPSEIFVFCCHRNKGGNKPSFAPRDWGFLKIFSHMHARQDNGGECRSRARSRDDFRGLRG